MVYRKKYYKKKPRYNKKKAVYKKKRTKAGKITKVNLTRFPNGIADQAIVKLSYATIKSFGDYNNAEVGFTSKPGVSSIWFAGDRLYDPGTVFDNYNANALQVYSLMYSHYTVTGSKITATVVNKQNGQVLFSLRPVQSGYLNPSQQDIVSQSMTDPNVRYAIIGDKEAANAICNKSCYISTRKLRGPNGLSILKAENNIRSTIEATDRAQDPYWYWLLTCSDLTQAAIDGGPGIDVLIKIQYYIKFYDRTDLDMSITPV